MIEEFQNKKGAFITHKGSALEFKDFEIRDLYNEMTELVVGWDKSSLIKNRSLEAFSTFKGSVVIRLGEEEFCMSTEKAFKLWKDMEVAIKESI